MKKNENEENEFYEVAAGAEAADQLTDSLLKNFAANPEGVDDEEFLDRVETAIDAASGGHVEFATTEVAEIPQPRVRIGWGRRLAWPAGIAALLAIGFGALSLHLDSGLVFESNPPQLTVALSDASEDSMMELQVVERYQQRPTTTASAATAPTNEALGIVPVKGPTAKDSGVKESLGDQPHPLAAAEPASTISESVHPVDAAPPMASFEESRSRFGAVGRESASVVTAFGQVPQSGSFVNSAARYGELIDNDWKSPSREPLSTFSIDVDTASWTNVRGMLERGVPMEQIPKDAVRIEEMINYFDWNYPQPDGDHPFGFAVESASCPWQADHRLLRVAIQGENVKRSKRPPANLVFLLDVSGSMNQPDKLPLLQQAIAVLVEELNAKDCVSIVVYAGAEGVALHPTKGNQQAEILDALNRLSAGGSTNGGAGIALAYKMAAENFIPDGINRVILCTDGDFNVGVTGTESLVQLVERKAKRDRTFLSVCGFGDDNLNDAMLEAITNKGNGTYYYIDSFAEARKVFLKDLMGTLVTIAKDVKIQIEFNPGEVKAYRLIGYSNRRLAAEDFANDKVDAGEIGAGHTVTAFYEIVPAGNADDPTQDVTSTLRYQRPVEPEPAPKPKLKIIPSHELALLKLRYKQPDEDTSKLIAFTVMPNERDWRQASADFRFASAVALFGLKLRNHESARDTELADILAITKNATSNDPLGYRTDFVNLLKQLDR